MKTDTHSIDHVMLHKNAGKYAPNIPHGVQDAIAAAYWAGQSAARAEEREANRVAIASAPSTRYHKIVAKALAGVNTSAVEGLTSEAAEISSWRHCLS